MKQKTKQARVVEWFKQHKCNILFMQETQWGIKRERVPIYIHSKVGYKLGSEFKDTEGRLIMANIEKDDCFTA